jgi:hypothetical protein
MIKMQICCIEREELVYVNFLVFPNFIKFTACIFSEKVVQGPSVSIIYKSGPQQNNCSLPKFDVGKLAASC